MILSGMSNMQQLQENIETFCQSKPLNEEEMAVLMGIADEMIRANKVPCTGCAYCTEHCTKGLLIPELIKAFNEEQTPAINGPGECIGCRKCEALCPQGIKISEVMKSFALRLQKG
jgi:predicted aldo/keto reductase-like oxidoreductase